MNTQNAQVVSWKNVEDEKERRLLRWALQAEARHWLPCERVAFCLRLVSPMSLRVEMLHTPEHQTTHYGGFIQCSLVWHRANCAAKISERLRSKDLEPVISYHIAQNGTVSMETYTISHTRFDSLPVCCKRF